MRSKMIANDEQMWELFEKYKEETKSNPRIKYVFGGKDFTQREEKLERPLTLVGFYNFCRREYCDVHHYFENTDKRYDSYRGICRAIKDVIRQDQIEGGMIGQYNPSITQRLNGLKEQVQQEHKGGVSLLNVDPLAEDEKD